MSIDTARPLDERYAENLRYPFVLANQHVSFVVPDGDAFNRLICACPHSEKYRAGRVCMLCATLPVEGLGTMFFGSAN